MTDLNWLALIHLYRDEGIDVSIRKAAEALGTTHTKLLKSYQSKEGVLQAAYVEATAMHFKDMLDRPRYIDNRNASTPVRKAIMIGQVMRSMNRIGYGSFSMQLWARPKLHPIILSAIQTGLITVAKQTGRPIEELSQSLFDGGIIEETTESLTDISKIFLRTAVTLFFACKGVNLIRVLGHPNATEGELHDFETTFFQNISRFI